MPAAPRPPIARFAPRTLLVAVLAGCGSDAAESPASPPPAEVEGSPGAGAPATAAPPENPRAQPRLRFVERAAALGLDRPNVAGGDPRSKPTILESIGQGAAWLDDDRDGLHDLYVVNGSTCGPGEPAPTNSYYVADGRGGFDDRSATSGADCPRWGNAVAAADYDGDGRTDLFVTNLGPHRLYRQIESHRFEDRAPEAGVTCAEDGFQPWGSAACWSDVDLDGDLDLFVGHYLEFDCADPPGGGILQTWRGIQEAYYGPLGCAAQPDRLLRNRGDGRFEDVTRSSGVAAKDAAYTLGALFGDFDLDGDADLYVANDSMPNYLFVNGGEGVFAERGELLGLAFGEQGQPQAGMGIAAGDFDGDGDDDLYVTNFDDDANSLYRNDGRLFRDVSFSLGLASASRRLLCWGCGFEDFDRDGVPELFTAAGHVYPRADEDDPMTSYRQADQLLTYDGKRFVPVEQALPTDRPGSTRGAAFADYDADGDVDVFCINLDEAPSLYENQSTAPGNWFAVRLVGTRSNRDAVGARATVITSGGSWSRERRAGSSFFSTDSPWLQFGLGESARVERVEVRWPGGGTSRHGPFDGNQRVVIEEP